MGVILAKFRKEKTTYEVLEELETKIKDIESFSITTQARQKRFIGNFLVFSVGLYVVASIVFYFAFFPSTWSKRIIYSTPLLIFPILIIFLKRLVAWFFQRKINRNANQLKTLRAEKKKIIEQVMDKETYKVACDILNRFGDATTRSQHQTSSASASPIQNHSLIASNLSTPQKSQPNKIGVTPQTQPRQIKMPVPTARTPLNARSIPTSMNALQTPSFGQYRIQSPAPTPVVARHQFGTPFPIINQSQKGMFEKIVDYLINDGPSTRYGMICKECYGHNGMVSQEEYEYSAFKCAFCKALNPAKKVRPIAPRLILPEKTTGESSNKPMPSKQLSSSSPPNTDKDSGSESDAVALELQKRRETQTSESETNAVETISGPIVTQEEPVNDANDEKESESSEPCKTHTDKKNE